MGGFHPRRGRDMGMQRDVRRCAFRVHAHRQFDERALACHNLRRRTRPRLSFQLPNGNLDMPSAQLSFTGPSEASHLRDRMEAILWIRTTIARYGITLVQLEESGCFVAERSGRNPISHKYIDALGHVWDGLGPIPEWLRRAINAGQSMDHFRAA